MLLVVVGQALRGHPRLVQPLTDGVGEGQVFVFRELGEEVGLISMGASAG